MEITARRFALRCTGPCDYRSSEAIVPQTFRGRHSLEWTKLCATRVVVNGAGNRYFKPKLHFARKLLRFRWRSRAWYQLSLFIYTSLQYICTFPTYTCLMETTRIWDAPPILGLWYPFILRFRRWSNYLCTLQVRSFVQAKRITETYFTTFAQAFDELSGKEIEQSFPIIFFF